MRKLIKPIVLFSLAVAGCKDSPTAPSYGPPATLLVLAGGATQAGVFGQPVPIAPTVLVTDASNRPVPGVLITFAITSGRGALSAASQTTGSNGTASVTWTLGSGFGTSTITATGSGLPAVTFTARAIAPAAGILAFNLDDPAGDTLAGDVTPRPRAIDLLSLRGDFKGDSLILTATFAAPVTLASGGSNQLAGLIEFDVDDNAATGVAPVSNTFGASASMGVEYLLSFFSSTPNTLTLASDAQQTPVTAIVSGNTVLVRIPMSALGGDDGNFTIAGVFGTLDRPTDIFPNAGQKTVRIGSGVSPALGATRELGRSAPAGHALLSRGWQLAVPGR